MKTILLTTLIGLLLVAVIGLATQNFCLNWQMDDLEKQADAIFAEGKAVGLLVLPSIEDIQRRVGAKVDGKVSPDYQNSETQEKWDIALCQQYANKYINAKSMEIEK